MATDACSSSADSEKEIKLTVSGDRIGSGCSSKRERKSPAGARISSASVTGYQVTLKLGLAFDLLDAILSVMNELTRMQAKG